MKLIRFGEAGKEKPGVIINDAWFDVSEYIHDYDEKFFESDGLALLKTIISEKTLKKFQEIFVLGPPIARPSKLICIGLNYSDHATESKMQLPPEPVIFFKATSAIVGPNDDLIIPKNSKKTDWEVELAVVIGKKASYVGRSCSIKLCSGLSFTQ
jgi:2-keto-4-pentenoate hydratase/2-oxohepta-3-ene-1,7-dioic acid hydratase in catechol pathway